MASKLWFILLVILSCLLHSTVSDKKKKIIVKVPHIIKHVHHDIFKPVHIHKVRAKKVEHHHHDEHEEKLSGWKPVKKQTKHHKKITKHKPYGSFSQLQPVSVHQNIDDHVEYPSTSGEEHQHALPHQHDKGLDFVREEATRFSNKPGKRKAKFINSQKSPKNLAPWRVKNWADDYSGEASIEDFGDYSEERGFSRLRRVPAVQQRRKRQKQTISSKLSPPLEDNAWTPLQNFNGWKDFDDSTKHAHILVKNNHVRHLNYQPDQPHPFVNSHEVPELGGNFEEHIYEFESEPSEEFYPPKQSRRNQKNQPKWSKEIKVQEHPGDEDVLYGQNSQQSSHQYQPPSQNVQPQNSFQSQGTELQNILTQQTPWSQTFQNFPVKPQFQSQSGQSVRNYEPPQSQPASWSMQNHQPLQIQQNPSFQYQQTTSSWLTQPTPVISPTQAPQVVWSGHHLQMPESSMWHVQQHSVQGGSDHGVQNSLPSLQIHKPPVVPQTQVIQGSSPARQVLPPGWPLGQKSSNGRSPVRQQWQQSVQTSGRDGPASSYKVEVVNYMDHKNGSQ